MIQALKVLMVCMFTAMLGLGIIGPIMPIYARILGATFVEIGLMASVWSVARLVFNPLMGRLSDMRSKKRIMEGGLVVYMVTSVLYAVAWDFTSLVSVRFLHGVGSAMMMPIAMAYAAELTPRGQEGRYMGMMNLAMFAGMGVGPFLGGSLTDLFSIAVPFYFMGALTALSLLLNLLFLPNDRSGSTMKRLRPSFKRILLNKPLRAVFFYRVVAAIGQGSIMGFLAIFISGQPEAGGLGLPLSVSGLILSAGQITSALMQRPFGELADRYNRIRLILVGGVLSVAGFALLPLSQEMWGVLVASLVWSMGGALAMPAMTAIVAIEGKELGAGSTMSVLDTAMSGGTVVGPLLSGLIIDLFGLKSTFYVGSLVLLAGTAVFYALTPKEQAKPRVPA